MAGVVYTDREVAILESPAGEENGTTIEATAAAAATVDPDLDISGDSVDSCVCDPTSGPVDDAISLDLGCNDVVECIHHDNPITPSCSRSGANGGVGPDYEGDVVIRRVKLLPKFLESGEEVVQEDCFRMEPDLRKHSIIKCTTCDAVVYVKYDANSIETTL